MKRFVELPRLRDRGGALTTHGEEDGDPCRLRRIGWFGFMAVEVDAGGGLDEFDHGEAARSDERHGGWIAGEIAVGELWTDFDPGIMQGKAAKHVHEDCLGHVWRVENK
jgi:hypothetical protein